MRISNRCFTVTLWFLPLFAALPASAMTYYLKKDLGVRNMQHLCLYSNDKVYSLNATDMCPMSVEDDSIGRSKATPQTGFKSGEYADGMTKVCVYDVLGKTEEVRFPLTTLCPLTYKFD